MKKRMLSALLMLSLFFTLVTPAYAAAPTRPSWCPAEEYVSFPGSAAYSGQTWEQLLSLWDYAASGKTEISRTADSRIYTTYSKLRSSSDPGVRFELGLIEVQLAMNALSQGKAAKGSTHFEMAASYTDDASAKYLCYLWNARLCLAAQDITTGLEGGLRWYSGAIEYLLAYEQFSFDAIYNCELVKLLPAERLSCAREQLFVTLDGKLVHPRSVRVRADYLDTTTAQARHNRTMVPVRRLAELMGATVDYDAATKQITITRAGDTIVLTLNSTTAYQNGTAFQMDVAPYAENNRTYIPIRYIAEFFGQKVDWNGRQQHVVITEDKTVAAPSNVEDWAIAMSALLNYENNPKEYDLFGGKHRFGANSVGSDVGDRFHTTGPDFGRKILSESWGIEDRESLLTTAAALASGESAWDWFRVSNLAQWGYLSGFVTYEEALKLVEPAARKVAKTYSSWDAAYTAYMTGYCAWAGLTGDIWQTERGQLYRQSVAGLLDDGLFKTGVIGLSG